MMNEKRKTERKKGIYKKTAWLVRSLTGSKCLRMEPCKNNVLQFLTST
jgi:hypothetical protein